MDLQALYQVAVLLTFNFGSSNFSLLQEGDAEHRNKLKNTLIFNAFVLCQVSPKFPYFFVNSSDIHQMKFRN